MEEKIIYKKCPYCELNYIPAKDYCCKVCFANSKIARHDAKSQRAKEYALANEEYIKQQNLIRKQQLELQKIDEHNKRQILLELWEDYGFIGFLHTTDFKNFVNIYKSKFLKSRNQLISEGVTFEDNAEMGVLENTLESFKSKVRFYYRPITPTNISAYIMHNQKNPVLIVFDKNLIFENNILFCNGCAGSSQTTKTNTATKALNFNWEDIFSTGPFNSDDIMLKNHRNAEFLITSPISLNKAIKFYFRNYKDYINACELFGNDERFEFNPKLFY